MRPCLTNEAEVWAPVWTPDGRRILFGWNVGGDGYEMFSVPADGSGPPEGLSLGDSGQTGDLSMSITSDGRTLIFSRQFDGNRVEVWELPLAGDQIARPVIEGAFRRGNTDVSPDGNWLAYFSDQSGQPEVYVQPYPGPGPIQPVSIGGGIGPVWSADGAELYYRRGSEVMAVDVNTSSGTIDISTPREFLPDTYISVQDTPGGNREYHVLPDERLLMLRANTPTDESAAPTDQLILVLNWHSELLERVPIP